MYRPCSSSKIRLKVYATSSEVTGLPSCHLASLLRWKVQVRPSSEVSQESARHRARVFGRGVDQQVVREAHDFVGGDLHYLEGVEPVYVVGAPDPEHELVVLARGVLRTRARGTGEQRDHGHQHHSRRDPSHIPFSPLPLDSSNAG